MTPQELQSLRNLGNECEAAADEIVRLRAERDVWKSKAEMRGVDACNARAERDEVRALNSAMIATLPGTYYMDPPDGGSVMPEEQMRRMSQDAARYRWLRDGERTLREWDSIRDLWESTLDAAIDAALSKEGK